MKPIITTLSIAALIVGSLTGCGTQQHTARIEQAAEHTAYNHLTPEAGLLAENALQTALETVPSQRSHFWSAGEGKASGSITPLTTVRLKDGTYCRTYRAVVLISRGVEHHYENTACRKHHTPHWHALPAQ